MQIFPSSRSPLLSRLYYRAASHTTFASGDDNATTRWKGEKPSQLPKHTIKMQFRVEYVCYAIGGLVQIM